VGLPCNLPVDMKRSERHKEHSHISHHQLQLSSTFPSDALVISRFDVFFSPLIAATVSYDLL